MTDTPDPQRALDPALKEIERLLFTDAALAESKAAEYLGASPGHPVATLLLGIARRYAGNPAGAIEALDPLARANPQSASAHYELGRACAAAGHREHAIGAMQRAVQLQPTLPGVWVSLTSELRAAGRDAEADAVCAARVNAAAGDPRIRQADAALRENRLDVANQLLRQQLEDDPTDIIAMQLLAAVALRVGQLVDAGKLLARCLELAPNYAAAHHDHALVLDRQMRQADALQAIEKALEIEPGNANYRNAQAVFLDRVGDYDRAVEVYRGLLDENPEQPKLWTSYGHALRAAGRQQDCVAAYRKCLEYAPETGEAWWGLADLKTFSFSDDEVEEMHRHLDRDGLSDDDRLHIGFALGKVLEDAGDFAGSFSHYAEANRLRRKSTPYDAARFTAQVQRSKALFTPDFFTGRAGCGSEAPDPIFIVGLPRSGSTLVEQILASHSAVEGTRELPNMGAIVRELGQSGAEPGEWKYPEVLAGLEPETFRALGERYLASTRIYRRTDRPMFVDKSPNNFADVGLIQLLMPNARIVDARRHPLACCFSSFKQHFASGQLFTYDLGDIGRFYRDYVSLMAHFDEVLPGRIHRVIYERLVDDTEAEIRALLEYCGLSFEERCLRFWETDRAVRTASSEQVRRPIDRAGLDHWRRFEPWLDPLKRALGPVLGAYPDVPGV